MSEKARNSTFWKREFSLERETALMPKTPELSHLHPTPQMEKEQSEYILC